MQEHDRDEVVKTLVRHFTGSGEGDSELLWPRVQKMDIADVTKAIEEHRLECGKQAYRPDIRRIISLAAEYRESRSCRSSQKFRIVDWIRASNRAAYAGVDNAAVIDDHYRGCWQELKKENPKIEEYGRQLMRAYIFAHARIANREIGMSDADGERSARSIVELGPDEKITGGKMFRTLAAPLDPEEELKKLAGYSPEDC